MNVQRWSLAGASVGLGLLWFAVATSGANVALELHPPPQLFDFFDYYRPNAIEAFGRVARGEIPLWTPFHGLGGPFLATLQTGVLYPPNLVHVWLPAQTAFACLAALHVALAAFFAGAFAAALGASALGALVAAACFGASVQIAGAVWTPPTLYAAALAPAVLLGVDRVAESPSARRVAGLALAVAMQALTGWPYFALMTGLAGALYGTSAIACRWIASTPNDRERGAPGGTRRLLALAAAVVTGAALAAPLLAPAQELAAGSARAFGTLDAKKAVLAALPHHPVLFFRALLEHGVNDGIPSIVALVLAPFAVGMRGRGRARAALLLAVGTLGMLIGFADYTPVYRALRALPVFGDFRFPFRWHLLPAIAIAVTAGLGLTRLQQASSGVAARAAVLLLAAIAISIQPWIVWRQVQPFPRIAAAPPPTVRYRMEAEVAARIDGMDRVFWEDRADRALGARGIRALHDLEPLTLVRTAEMLTWLELGRAVTVEPLRGPAADGNDPVEGATAPYYGRLGLPKDLARMALLDVLAVRWIVTRQPSAGLLERLPTVAERADGTRLLENPSALQRIRRVREAERAPRDADATLSRLAAADFPRAHRVLLSDIDGEALHPLDADSTASQAPQTQATAAHGLAPMVHVTRDDPEWIEFETSDAQAGWVVVADAFFPGWEATVDGAASRVLRANHGLRAVAVPEGRSRVVMRYRPMTFRFGLFAAGTAVLVLSALCLFGHRRSRGPTSCGGETRG